MEMASQERLWLCEELHSLDLNKLSKPLLVNPGSASAEGEAPAGAEDSQNAAGSPGVPVPPLGANQNSLNPTWSKLTKGKIRLPAVPTATAEFS